MSNKLTKKSAKAMTMEDIKKSNDILMKEVAALIDTEVEKRVAAEREAVKIEMMNVMFGIPVMVLKEHYWKKSYGNADKLPSFVHLMVKYYERWNDNEITMSELKDILWKDAGIQFDKDAASVKCPESDWENARES